MKVLLGILIPILVVSVVFGSVLFFVSSNLITSHIIPQYNQNLVLNMEKFSVLFDEDTINKAKTDEGNIQGITARNYSISRRI